MLARDCIGQSRDGSIFTDPFECGPIMKPSRRKRHFIDKKVQGALLLRMVQHWALFMLGTLAFLTCLEVLVSGYEVPVSELVWRVWGRHQAFIVAALVVQPAFFYDIIKLSHRFVGPVARVRTELRNLAEGKQAAPIKLRDNDFWSDLATDFNRALAQIQPEKSTVSVAEEYSDSTPAEAELQTC